MQVYGVIKADGSRYFPEKLVTGVFSRKPIETNPGIKVIFIGVDPARYPLPRDGLQPPPARFR